MLLKLLLSLVGIFSHHGHRDREQQKEFVPTAYGPQSLAEEEITRKALFGEHFGGDMIFPKGWNETDAGIKDPRFRWPGYPGRGVVPYVLDGSVRFNYGNKNLKTVFFFLEQFERQIRQGMEQYHKLTCI